MKPSVAVAMSGGVDSSVVAAILKDKGYRVLGITMCLENTDSNAREDALLVADFLGIKHFSLDARQIFKRKVVDDFCRQYLKGKTPNPCIICNEYIKFGFLLQKALSFGADYLATGHYARLEKSGSEYLLKKAKDNFKDQSYFLYRLNQRQLAKTMFPLGNFTKARIRNIAEEFCLPVASKPDSQEICFIPGNNYREFFRGFKNIKSGLIINPEGKIIGKHQGIPFYTIGQRGGLGIALGYPAYIYDIDVKNNAIKVGPKDLAYRKEFIIGGLNFISKPIKRKISLKVKIRYNQKEAWAQIEPCRDKLKVVFKSAQFAVTPGQSAVLYDRDKVVGGGVIERMVG